MVGYAKAAAQYEASTDQMDCGCDSGFCDCDEKGGQDDTRNTGRDRPMENADQYWGQLVDAWYEIGALKQTIKSYEEKIQALIAKLENTK